MKQIIRLTEEDIHNIIKGVIQEIVDEYGTPEQLGALAARRAIKGGDSKEVHNYAHKKGARTPSYYKGYIAYLQSHPEEMAKYVKNKIHKKLK